jgi:hypothetical protein
LSYMTSCDVASIIRQSIVLGTLLRI